MALGASRARNEPSGSQAKTSGLVVLTFEQRKGHPPARQQDRPASQSFERSSQEVKFIASFRLPLFPALFPLLKVFLTPCPSTLSLSLSLSLFKPQVKRDAPPSFSPSKGLIRFLSIQKERGRETPPHRSIFPSQAKRLVEHNGNQIRTQMNECNQLLGHGRVVYLDNLIELEPNNVRAIEKVLPPARLHLLLESCSS